MRTSAPTGSEQTAYTCASDETAILKDVGVSVLTGTPTRIVVWVQASGGARVSLLDRAMGALDVVRLSCWVVLLPGDSIGIYSQTGNITVWLSGTELEGLAD